jgi:transcription antitermination protein NusB
MALPPAKFREVVFQMLYSHDVSAGEPADVVPLVAEQLRVSRSNLRSAQERMEQIVERLPELDGQLSEHVEEYALERVPRVERNALRLGLYEILHDPSVPPKVALSEAMRLARKFGSPESARFVNAILDALLPS